MLIICIVVQLANKPFVKVYNEWFNLYRPASANLISFDSYLSLVLLIEGYYVPNFGDGIIAALNKKAGIALLELKLFKKPFVVIPEKNHAASYFLRKNKFQEYSVASRMVLGKPVNWYPEGIYCRTAGDCG